MDPGGELDAIAGDIHRHARRGTSIDFLETDAHFDELDRPEFRKLIPGKRRPMRCTERDWPQLPSERPKVPVKLVQSCGIGCAQWRGRGQALCLARLVQCGNGGWPIRRSGPEPFHTGCLFDGGRFLIRWQPFANRPDSYRVPSNPADNRVLEDCL